jgi:glycosyltransferase involved in cell wall biosynthesis
VDIAVVPLSGKSRFNLAKSPTKIFEYMAKKVPVIASKIGEAEHIIEDGHSGFLSANKDELVFYMEKLARDLCLSHRLADNAYRRIEDEYSLSILGKRLYAIFAQNFNLGQDEVEEKCLRR